MNNWRENDERVITAKDTQDALRIIALAQRGHGLTRFRIIDEPGSGPLVDEINQCAAGWGVGYQTLEKYREFLNKARPGHGLRITIDPMCYRRTSDLIRSLKGFI